MKITEYDRANGARLDTSPEIAAAVRERIMQFSGAERFIMGARMFESARAVVLASLPKDISETERRRILFQRLYGDLPLTGSQK